MLGALVIAARHRGVNLSVGQLTHDHLLRPEDVTWETIARLARLSGLKATTTHLAWNDVVKLGKAVPALLRLSNGFVMVLLKVERNGDVVNLRLQDPLADSETRITLDEQRFCQSCTGDVLLLKRDYPLVSEDQPFGLRAIAGRVLMSRQIARDLVIAAFMLGLLSAAPIVFWRLLIDRVIYYKAFNTLAVLSLAMIVVVATETAFSWLRRHLTQNLVRRVDVGLWNDMFSELLTLPVSFFERSQTGVVTRDMFEVFKIRSFLSEAVFGTGLDTLVLIIFLPIMFYFSVTLTLIVMGMCLVICVWIVLMMPYIHAKSARVFRAEGKKGAFLVETLQGIRTVKSLALDARRKREFDVLVAQAAEYRYEESSAANLISTVIVPLERFMTSGIVAVAVYLAIARDQQVYIGSLVAFMMLSMRVAAPLMELSTMIQKLDDARIAVATIKQLLNQPKEIGRSEHALRPPIFGAVEFHDVRFTYPGSLNPALDQVSFSMPAGTIFGIMGRSGSGKTTVTRLLQMLHSDYQGQIKIDGHSLAQLDIDHVRSSIGVVLQENFLFSGTISSTISATKPDARLEEIVVAARLAGAEEFIERLPEGYNTQIYEGSPNMSGGQRQRLAIARALINNPRILILDEATSALDAESEAIVNANLMNIAKGRTVIIISHRLSSLVVADAIMVLERGSVHDIGRHDELLERSDIYSSLWRQQHRHLEWSHAARKSLSS
jgi:ATP-binding cassette subfamily B protein